MGVEPLEQAIEVVPGELPLEWLGDLLVALAEGEDPSFELLEVGEVARLECLALKNREVDLDLVEQLAWIGRWTRTRFL